jgi:hypothetical protein
MMGLGVANPHHRRNGFFMHDQNTTVFPRQVVATTLAPARGYDQERVSIRRTRFARFVKRFSFALPAHIGDAASATASIFMPLSGRIGSQTLVLTGSANTYGSTNVIP